MLDSNKEEEEIVNIFAGKKPAEEEGVSQRGAGGLGGLGGLGWWWIVRRSWSQKIIHLITSQI